MSHIGYKSSKLAKFVRSILEENPLGASVFLLTLKMRRPREASRDIEAAFFPGGEADEVLTKLENPTTARAYCRALRRRFAPFADILRDTIPRGGVWQRRTRISCWKYVAEVETAPLNTTPICECAGRPATRNQTTQRENHHGE